jgi:hypothetical protein
MNNDVFPPWSALPQEVRDRVMERMLKRYGTEDDQRTEEYRQDLRNLSAFRLINAYGLKAAMRKGSDFPAFGPDPAAWLAAYQRCQATLEREANDPLAIERSQFILAIVQEELARFNNP